MSGRLDGFVACFGENLLRAVAAAAAGSADAQGVRELLERARAVLGALAHLAFGYRVAEADVHAVLSKMLLIPIGNANSPFRLTILLAFTYLKNIETMNYGARRLVDNNNENNYRYCQHRT